MEYHWPGNIRELENVIERTVNIMPGSTVLAESVILDNCFISETAATLSMAVRPVELPPSEDGRPLKDLVAEAERAALAQALKRYTTSRKIGSALGLSHTAVLKKIQKYALQLPKK